MQKFVPVLCKIKKIKYFDYKYFAVYAFRIISLKILYITKNINSSCKYYYLSKTL